MWVIEINVSIYDERGPHEGACLFHGDQIVARLETQEEARSFAEERLTLIWKQEIGFDQNDDSGLAVDKPEFDGRWEHEDECNGTDGESLLLEFSFGGGVDGFGDGPTTREYAAVIYKEA